MLFVRSISHALEALRYFHGWDVTKSSFYRYRGNRCTQLHFWYPFLAHLATAKAAVIQEPWTCNAEVSITAFDFTDQKTETQKCKTNCFSCDAIIYKAQLWSIQVYLFDPSAFLSFWGAFL